MGLSVAAIKGRVFHARKELGRALRYYAVSLEAGVEVRLVYDRADFGLATL